jgi:hypothetical protein
VKHIPENQTVTLVRPSIRGAESDVNTRSIKRIRPLLPVATQSFTAMVPVSMVYGTPEDSAAELAYLRSAAIPFLMEMGEERTASHVAGRYAALSAMGQRTP